MLANDDPEKKEFRRLVAAYLRKQGEGIVRSRDIRNLQEFLDKEWVGDFSMADVGEVFMDELSMIEVTEEPS